MPKTTREARTCHAAHDEGAGPHSVLRLHANTNLHEPFERLIESGIRLNGLRSEAELREILIDEAQNSAAPSACCWWPKPDGLEIAGSHLPGRRRGLAAPGDHALAR
jgi:hypothetical protein